MVAPGDGIPGAELVAAGVEALRRGELSIEALLVAVGAPRLRSLGIPVPDDGRLPHHPELALYHAVGQRYPDDAHSRYNALIRRLVSFEHELERRRYSATKRPTQAGSSGMKRN
ncbi:MAG: hypothetical protein OXU42_02680 [Deltaproteobacteria bacterium]|nr:hypothetical protein [Deltaproteobacteria bacterium]